MRGQVKAGALLAPTSVVLALVGPAACGGGSSASSITQNAASTMTSSAPSTTSKADTSQPTAKAPRSSGTIPSGGGAAGFRMRGADNSIPDYGEEASAAERRAAGTALAAYLGALAKGQWPKACPHVASSMRRSLERLASTAKQLKGAGCAGDLNALVARISSVRADPFSGALAAFRVKGTQAFALFRGPDRQKYYMPMASEGGAWRVTQFAPDAYPLGIPAPASR